MSGWEIAGIVLATLPLFVEATKSYARGADTIRKVSSHRQRDQKLADFYYTFWWELLQLDRQLRTIVHSLPSLSTTRKAELFVEMRSDLWKPGAEVSHAFLDCFGSEDEVNSFLLVVGKVAQLLCQLVKDPTIHISPRDLDQSKMVVKLKSFSSDVKAGKTSSTLSGRLRFWKKDEERSFCLANLSTWNQRLGCLTTAPAGAWRAPISKEATASGLRIASSGARMLSQKLYRALAKCWRSCNCNYPHEAIFCLKPCGDTDMTSDIPDIDLDFVISVQANDAGPLGWQEGKVLIRPNSTNHDDRSLLQKICDALSCSGPADHCLQLLVEDEGTDHTVWQLRSIPARLPKSGCVKSVSLHKVLENAVKLPCATKYRLALIFAHSLLRFHDNNWLRNGLKKDHIFFRTSKDTTDFERPYVLTVFVEDTSAVPATKPDLNQFHRNSSILSLGILLIELNTGRCIESFRADADWHEANANTDLLVAYRVVKEHPNDFSWRYRDAVQACLDTHWIPAGQKVSLEDVNTRSGLYENVVQPLAEELSFLFRERV